MECFVKISPQEMDLRFFVKVVTFNKLVLELFATVLVHIPKGVGQGLSLDYSFSKLSSFLINSVKTRKILGIC